MRHQWIVQGDRQTHVALRCGRSERQIRSVLPHFHTGAASPAGIARRLAPKL